jgi:hypothetical protein
MIEIGANYSEHATPMLNYFFYGPNFPEYASSSDESDRTFRGYETCPPFKCNQSMLELLQIFYGKAEGVTFNSMPLSMFVPPVRLDAISGPTITESFGLIDCLANEATPLIGVEVIGKDPTFRWSMLSIEEGQFDDAPDSETRVSFDARSVDNGFDKVQSSNSKIIILQSREQSGHDLKVGSVAVTPLIPFIPTFTTPSCRKVFRPDFKFAINFSGLASEINTYTDLPMLSPMSRKGSSQTTAPPSLLGLGPFVEGESDMTGITSVVHLGSPFGVDTSEILVSDAIGKNNSYAIPSTLGNSAVGELVPSLPPAVSETTSHAEDGSSDRIGFYGHSEPVLQGSFSSQMMDNADRTLVSISSPIECPTWNFHALHGRAVAQVRVLLKRTARFTRLTSGWVKHFWSATCSYKTRIVQ